LKIKREVVGGISANTKTVKKYYGDGQMLHDFLLKRPIKASAQALTGFNH